MAQVNYPDINVTEEDQIVTYSTMGVKVRRVFKVDFCDQSVPTSTLYSILTGGEQIPTAMQMPVRGSPHPSIVIQDIYGWANYQNFPTALCVDVMTVKAISSTQALVELEYSVLNGMTQEPSEDNDTAPALMTIGASVQSTETAVDVNGTQIAFPYDTHGPSPEYQIYLGPNATGTAIVPVASTYDPFVPGIPNVKGTAQVQIPNTLLRFHRRETKPRSPLGLVGFINQSDWSLPTQMSGATNYPAATILCTRIENETHDNGTSWVVLYEFQVGQPKLYPTASVPRFVDPSEAVSVAGKSYTAPWDVGGFYILPSGSGSTTGSTPLPALMPGQTPEDSVPFIFRIYGEVDFNGTLSLTT